MSEHLPSWYYEQAMDYIDFLWNANFTNKELHEVTRRQRNAEYKLMEEREREKEVDSLSEPKKETGIRVQKTLSAKVVAPMMPSLPPGIRDVRCAYYPTCQQFDKKTDQNLFSRRKVSHFVQCPPIQSLPTEVLPPAT